MPAPATADEFLDLVQKSGVVDAPRLSAYAARLVSAGAWPLPPAQLADGMVRDGLLSGFQVEQLMQGRYKRFFIGKYKVLERLGRGGMANVFLCEHKMMRRKVAVKVLPAAKGQDPASLDRFHREARAVAAVDHPNLVRAYDIDQDAGLHFIVMEYVDGTNLYDLVKRHGPLDPVRAAHYIAGAAVGLEHAHEMGLVHRDIKPGNILIDRAGTVKVLDMGLALFFQTDDEDDQLTKKYDETVLGTADYLAPEQAIDSHTVDIRADIYSLGGTFYYLLTGRPPFPDGSVAQKLLWHQSKAPTPVEAVRPDVPPELSAVVARMMAKDPADRPQTPADVAAVLAPWTQTPIPPPSEDELPQFGPASGPPMRAASGTGSGLRTAGAANTTPRPGLTTEVRPVPAATAPARALPPAAGRAEAAPDVWSAVAESPAPDNAPPPRPKRAAKKANPKRTALLLVLAAVGLTVLAGGALAVVWLKKAKPAPSAGQKR